MSDRLSAAKNNQPIDYSKARLLTKKEDDQAFGTPPNSLKATDQQLVDTWKQVDPEYNTPEQPGDWSNIGDFAKHVITRAITEPLAGLAGMARNAIYGDSLPPLYKTVNDYDAAGSVIGTHSEMTDYGKQVDNGTSKDPMGNFVLGLDAYNNVTSDLDRKNPLPHTFLGNTATGAITLAPTLGMTMLAPEADLAEGAPSVAEGINTMDGASAVKAVSTVNKLKAAVWNPFTKIMSTNGFLKGYSEGQQKGEGDTGSMLEGLKGGGTEAVNAGVMGLLGGVSGEYIAPKIYKSLIDNNIVDGTGKLTQLGVNAISDAAVFGAYPIVSNLAQGKPVNLDEIESSAGMGLMFGAVRGLKNFKGWDDANEQLKNVWADRYAMATQNFMNASPNAISDVMNYGASDSDLFAKATEMAAKAKEEMDPAKKKQYAGMASTLAKMSDIKGTVDAITHDTQGFIDSIEKSDLPDDQKQALIQRANEIANTYKEPTGAKPSGLIGDQTQEAPAAEPAQPAAPAPQAPPPSSPAVDPSQLDDLDDELDVFKQPAENKNAIQEKGLSLDKQENNGEPNSNKNVVPEGTQTQSGVNRTAATNNANEPPATGMGSQPSREKAVTGNITKESNNSPEELNRQSEATQGEGQHILARDDGNGLPVRASGDNGKEIGAETAEIGSSTSHKPRQSGQPGGESNDNVTGGTHEVSQSIQEEAQTTVGRQPAGEHGLAEKPYYVALKDPEVGKYSHNEVEGKPLQNNHGLDLFTHDITGGVAVSEGSTGLQLAKGRTQLQAINNAEELLNTKTPAEIQALINQKYESGIKSPRGKVKPETGASTTESTDTENTETIIAKATATVGKAKATARGSAESAGVVDELDKAIGEVDKEITNLGGNPESQPEPEPAKEEPKAEQSEQEKRKADREAKKAKVKEKLDAAKKAFIDSINKATSGIDPETLAKGLKMMATYAEAGLLKFSEIAEDLAEDLGEKLRDVWDALKASYLAYGAHATEEELDAMDDTRSVRKENIDDYLPEENGTDNERQRVEGNSPELPAGQLPGKAANALPAKQTEEVPGRHDNNGGENGNGDNGKQTVPEVRPGGGDDNRSVTGAGSRPDKQGVRSKNAGSGVSKNTEKRNLKPEDRNHIIEKSDQIGQGTSLEKFNNNMDAIFLLKKLESEDRNPTAEEKKVLANFVGWGGLAEYLKGSDYSNEVAVNTAVNGGRQSVRTNRWDTKVLDFTGAGKVNPSDYASFSELANAIKNKLNNSGYPIGIDDVRKSLVSSLFTNDELNAAKNSTINAHYTERQVIDKMWELAKQLGFKGGNMLETSAGIGNFLGLLPKDLRDTTKMTGYELDSITGRMLKKLYPEAKITVSGFEKSNVAPNSQDLVIGNVPFAQKAPFDKNYPDISKFNMHNYFIGKSMRLLKPGGLAMVITSKSTLDGDPKFREWMSSPDGGNSVLVGAIRLPNNAFSENAGTQVTTDIVVFRKRDNNKTNPLENDFRYTYPIDEKHYDKEGNEIPININQYYHQHPENMLGKMMTADEAGSGGLYGGKDATLHAPAGYNVMSGLNKAIKSFPSDIIQQEEQVPAEKPAEENIEAIDKKEGSMFEKDNKIYLVKNGEGVPQTALTPAQAKVAKSYVALKTTLLELIKQELSAEPTADIEALRKDLNKKYDDFVEKNKALHKNRVLKFLEDDVDYPLVQSLEEAKDKFVDDGKGGGKKVTDIKKSALFEKRINFPRTEPTTADNIKDAINISFNYRNGLDLNYISKLLGQPVDEVKNTLINENLAFENPNTGLLETPEEYLSGYVRDKLAQANAAAETDDKFRRNVSELEKVIPKDIPASLIQYSLGSTWVPPTIYEDFVKNLLGVDSNIKYKEALGKWDIDAGYGQSDSRNRTTYSGGGVDGVRLLENALNNIQTTVNYPKSDGGGVNPQATEEARERQAQIEDEFINFMRSNKEAQDITEPIYNQIYNNFVERNWLTPDIKYYPGQSKTISLYDEQKRSVARGLAESTLGAQEVGFGKSLVQHILAMEAKRLGLAKKTMVVVQKATLGQYVTSFHRMYPAAKILAPSEADFNAENRAKLYAKISTQDWDAIIMPHSQFDMIPDKPERRKAYIQEKIDNLQKAIDEADNAADKKAIESKLRDLDYEMRLVDDPDALKMNAKGEYIEKKGKNVKNEAKKALSTEAKMEKLLNRHTDKSALHFEDMGIDNLIVDEAHQYKKLGLTTALQNIKGIDQTASKRAQSLYLKTRHIQEKTGGKNVNFFTGTPISNTMAEVWTWMRFIRPELVERLGITSFDQFVNTFGVIANDIEFNATGSFKNVNRFRSFKNAPELLTAFRSIAHIVLKDDVKEITDAGSVPKLLNGKRTQNIIPLTPPVKEILDSIVRQLKAWGDLPAMEKKTGRNRSIPMVLYGHAKMASIDPRMYNPDAVDHPDSKVNNLVRAIVKKHAETKAIKGTQMIFSDRQNSMTGDRQYLDENGEFLNPAYGKKQFNVFEDIKKKLIAAGITESEIAIATDPKYDKQERKEALFEAVNEGLVRVAMGSTEKMGTGVNAQKHLVNIQHLDVPNRPMDMIQREGRGLRPGNQNKEIEIGNNGMEGTADTMAYGVVAFKEKFIKQLMTNGTVERVIDDAAGEDVPTYDEMMARLSGSKYAIEKIKTDANIKREKTKKDIFAGRIIQAKRDLQSAQSNLNRNKAALTEDEFNAAKVQKSFPGGEITKVEISGKPAVDEKFAGAVDEYIDRLNKKYEESPTKYATGEIQINDVPVQMSLHEGLGGPMLEYRVMDLGIKDPYHTGKGIAVPSGKGVGMLSSLRSKLDDVLEKPDKTKAQIIQNENNIKQLNEDINQKFDDTHLKELEKRSETLKNLMIEEGVEKEKAENERLSNTDYILDQSNIKPAIDFLDKLKAKPGGTAMMSVVPMGPQIWNAGIEVVKNTLRATNSLQKALRVAGKYIVDRTGDAYAAEDFKQSIGDQLATTKAGQAATAPDTEDTSSEENLIKAATDLQAKIKPGSPDEKAFASLPLAGLTKKQLHKYIEVAAVMAADPDGVLQADVDDAVLPVNQAILADEIKNINAGGGALPPTTPPVNTTTSGEDDDEFQKGEFDKKVNVPMDEARAALKAANGGEMPEEPVSGKRFYTLYRAAKDYHVRNLEQLRKFGKDIGSMDTVRKMIKLASTKSIARVDMVIANSKIEKLIGESRYQALREALMESNLRGTKQRWLGFADSIENATDDQVDHLFEDGKEAPMFSILKTIPGYMDDENPAQTILALLSNGDYDNVRMYMSEMFNNAANNTAFFGKLSNGKTFNDMVQIKDGKYQFVDPKFEQAHQLYKQFIEKPFMESHAENAGIFSSALGPLNTYYPMTAIGDDAHKIIMPSKGKYNAPENINNHFRTGQADLYSEELAALGRKLIASLKTNNKAAAIRAMQDAGLIQAVSEGDQRKLININGVAFDATIVPVSESRTIINTDKVIHTSTRYMAVPDFLYHEIKPFIEGNDLNAKGQYNAVGRFMNATVNFALGGPAEGVGHSYRLLSAIISSMPYMQEWAYNNGIVGHAGGLVLNNPIVKMFGGMGKILFTSATSDEFMQDIQDMAKLGLIPEKTWTHTWSKEFARIAGVEPTQFLIPYKDLFSGDMTRFKKAFDMSKTKWFDFSPMLYGQHGFDLKARVVMYRLCKAMNPYATPEQLFRMQDAMGQYTQELQSTVEKAIKRTGFGPYATFARAFWRQGVLSVTGLAPLPLDNPLREGGFGDPKKVLQFSYYHLAKMLTGGLLGLAATWAIVHRMLHDKWPWDDPHSKFLKTQPSDWLKQKEFFKKYYYNKRTHSFDDLNFGFFNIAADRGSKAFGIPKGWETYQLGGSAGQISEAVQLQMINTYLSQYTSSPFVSAGFRSLTGSAPYLTSFRNFRGQGETSFVHKSKTQEPGMQFLGNFGGGVADINSTLGNVNPFNGMVDDEYNADDYAGNKIVKSILNIGIPNLITPHGGEDTKKQTAIKKQTEAIKTTIKKEAKEK